MTKTKQKHNNKKFSKILIGSAAVSAVATMSMASGVAVAASFDENTAPNTDDTASQKQSEDGKHKDTNSYTATIYATGTDGARPVQVDTSSTTVSEALDKAGLDVNDFKSADGKAVDADHTLSNGEKMLLFKNEVSEAKTETVSIPAPETKKESADLYVGETKVESEGKAGQAIKTSVSVKDTAADAKVNKNSSKVADSSGTKENITVVTPPEAKVVLVGTKEKPAEPVQSTPSGSSAEADAAEAAGIASVASTNKSGASMSSNSLSSVLSSTSSDGAKAVEIAKAQVGKNYVWGSAGPDSFDCSGLVYYAYTSQGYDIPRTAYEIGSSAKQISRSELQPGDILYTSTHIGIYMGDGKVVHAATESRGVVIDSMDYFSGYQAARIAR
jgi:npl/p60 family secreted protein